MAKCGEIATSLILARWLGFAPRNDDKGYFMENCDQQRVAAPNLFGAEHLKRHPQTSLGMPPGRTRNFIKWVMADL